MLFHRVDDRLKGNPVSCTREAFEQYCLFFRRHFHVVPLPELLHRLKAGEEVGGLLAITFDDGYRDNYTIAAPVLQRLGMPACFFVSTGLIGSDVRPWWDEEYGARSEWMGWADVRALRAAGFDIGAHTETHPDLGVVRGEEALREIQGSRTRLEEELGECVQLFSYPYGRPHQLSEENRERVRDSGFSCCFSAHGGTVAVGDDPFRLRRVAVTPWHRSPEQFGFELLVSHR